MALLWLKSENSKAQEDAMSMAWFFFGVMVTKINIRSSCYHCFVYSCSQIKSMAQHLQQTGNLNTSRKNLFSTSYLVNLQYLIEIFAKEIAEKHIKRFEHAYKLNISVAYFFMDVLSLMDRGFVFFLIRSYIKKVRYVYKSVD